MVQMQGHEVSIGKASRDEIGEVGFGSCWAS